MCGTLCIKQHIRLPPLVQTLTDSQSDHGSQSLWNQSFYNPCALSHPQGHLPKVQRWASHFLVGTTTWHPSAHQKVTLLAFQSSSYPLVSAPLRSSSLLPIEQPSFNKFIYSRSLFPNMSWLPCLQSLLTCAYNTHPAFTYLSLTLLWRGKSVSYLITFLNTLDYRDHSLRWTPSELAFLR